MWKKQFRLSVLYYKKNIFQLYGLMSVKKMSAKSKIFSAANYQDHGASSSG